MIFSFLRFRTFGCRRYLRALCRYAEEGDFPSKSEETIEHHLDTCASCRRIFTLARQTEKQITTLKPAVPSHAISQRIAWAVFSNKEDSSGTYQQLPETSGSSSLSLAAGLKSAVWPAALGACLLATATSGFAYYQHQYSMPHDRSYGDPLIVLGHAAYAPDTDPDPDEVVTSLLAL